MAIELRKATAEDIAAIEELIPASVRGLQREQYSEEQREAALEAVFTVDRQLIGDGTYFVAEAEGRIVACGGWSRRKTLYGGHGVAGRDDAWLDPATEPARIRAFFVHPDFARRGIGTMMLAACESEAAALGFRSLEMAATLPGVPLYEARGYRKREPLEVPLREGLSLTVIRMSKRIGGA